MPSLTGTHPTSIRSRRAATMRGVNCWRASADPSVIDSYVHIYLLRGRVGAWQKHYRLNYPCEGAKQALISTLL